MSKIFQIADGICAWHTKYKSVRDAKSEYPPKSVFVEAPDYVFEGWGYIEYDEDGNPINGNNRFVKPIPEKGFIYDDETGKIVPDTELPKILKRLQDKKQEENKALFAEYLESNPLSWIDGKVYGCSLEDQTEIQLNISQYQIQLQAGVSNPVLEWHAKNEACVKWSFDDLSALTLAISQHVYPWFHKMNKYKQQIYQSKTIEELQSIVLDYE